MWWLTMLLSSAASVGLATWGCQYRELQPVFFGGGRILGNNATPSAAAALSAPENEEHGDEEMGFSRGRGRGRERNGEYEMVKMEGVRE